MLPAGMLPSAKSAATSQAKIGSDCSPPMCALPVVTQLVGASPVRGATASLQKLGGRWCSASKSHDLNQLQSLCMTETDT